jgi:hypothetical protein
VSLAAEGNGVAKLATRSIGHDKLNAAMDLAGTIRSFEQR